MLLLCSDDWIINIALTKTQDKKHSVNKKSKKNPGGHFQASGIGGGKEEVWIFALLSSGKALCDLFLKASDKGYRVAAVADRPSDYYMVCPINYRLFGGGYPFLIIVVF